MLRVILTKVLGRGDNAYAYAYDDTCVEKSHGHAPLAYHTGMPHWHAAIAPAVRVRFLTETRTPEHAYPGPSALI